MPTATPLRTRRPTWLRPQPRSPPLPERVRAAATAFGPRRERPADGCQLSTAARRRTRLWKGFGKGQREAKRKEPGTPGSNRGAPPSLPQLHLPTSREACKPRDGRRAGTVTGFARAVKPAPESSGAYDLYALAPHQTQTPGSSC